MNDSTYELEWRGSKKSGYSYADIEEALASGELHSLYKVHVNDRRVVLRDFVEQQRAIRASAMVSQPPPQVVPQPQLMQPPPPPLDRARLSESPYSVARAGRSAQKPAWFWPTIILSSTVCLLLVLVLGYIINTSRSSSQRIITASASSPTSAAPAVTASSSFPPPPAPFAPGSPPAPVIAAPPITAPSVVAPSGIPAAAATPTAPGMVATSGPPAVAASPLTPGMAASPAAPVVAPAVPASPGAPPPASTTTATTETKPPATTTNTVAAAASTVAKTEDKPAEDRKAVKFTSSSMTGKEIYPSAVIPLATIDWNGEAQRAEDKKTDKDTQLRKNELPLYGDENGWLGLNVEGLKQGDQISVEIFSDGFIKPSKWQGTITAVSPKGRAEIYPKIIWNYEALIKIHQQRPFNVTFSASLNGKPSPEFSETYTLRSINDCPIYLKPDKSGEKGSTLKFLLAAYVNENHPLVQEVLKEALASNLMKEFTGYQTENPNEVRRQVYSIWNVLQRRGIKYSDVTTTPPGDKVVCQTVRFMDQSINSHQANCVDGSVLMASILQKIGIKSYLVLIPGHCFLAFDLYEDSTALPMGLETTLLGSNEIKEVKNINFLTAQQRLKENEASLRTFLHATQVGSDKIAQCSRILQNGKVPGYELISIEESRNFGIMPIPFTMDK